MKLRVKRKDGKIVRDKEVLEALWNQDVAREKMIYR